MSSSLLVSFRWILSVFASSSSHVVILVLLPNACESNKDAAYMYYTWLSYGYAFAAGSC